jgi:hypothetical protein
MAVAELRTADASVHPVDQPLSAPGSQDLLRAALLAGDVEPTDPMERALHDCAGERAGDWLAALTPVSRSGLRPGRMAIVRRWQTAGGAVCEVAKGAPEAVADLCGLPPEARRQMQRQVAAMAERGLRVLAVAVRRGAAGSLRWLGLVGLADPLREGVPDAVARCRGAGIRRGDDHRRPPGHCTCHRRSGRHRPSRGGNRRRTGGGRRFRPAPAGERGQRVRPHRPLAEAAHRARAAGCRRGGGDDR